MENVVVTINSTIVADRTESIEFTTEGRIDRVNGKWTIIYHEDTEDGGKQLTTIRVSDDGKVTISRSGENNSRLIIEKGKRYICHYDTRFGSFELAVQGNCTDCSLENGEGKIDIEYSIDINAEHLSDNHIEIIVRKDKNTDE